MEVYRSTKRNNLSQPQKWWTDDYRAAEHYAIQNNDDVILIAELPEVELETLDIPEEEDWDWCWEYRNEFNKNRNYELSDVTEQGREHTSYYIANGITKYQIEEV